MIIKFKPEMITETKSPSSTFSSFAKKLLIGGIIILKLTGCATTNYNVGSSIDPVGNEQNEGSVSAEKKKVYVDYNRRYYDYKVEVKGDYIYEYWDGVLTTTTYVPKLLKDPAFGGKLYINKIILGDPSIMFIGIDTKGNFGFIIFSTIVGNSKMTPIKSELPAKKMEELGIRLEVKYDEKRKEYQLCCIDEKQKILRSTIFTENGEKIKDVDFGLDEILDAVETQK